MTKEDFYKTRYHLDMEVEYCGRACRVENIDYDEALFLIEIRHSEEEEAEFRWVRCESVKLIK